MRFILALLAVLTLIASPTLAAAGCRCDGPAKAKAGCAEMPGMAAMSMDAAKANPAAPCHSGAKQNLGDKGCARMCAAAAILAVEVRAADFATPVSFAGVVMAAPVGVGAGSADPSGLKRPPKHIV